MGRSRQRNASSEGATAPAKTPALWRASYGERGRRVEVCERTAGGMLYYRVWSPDQRGQVYRSLRHRDKQRARDFARELAEQLAAGAAALEGPLTLGRLIALYLEHRSPEKRSASTQREDQRRAALWRRQLGEDTPALQVTVPKVARILRARVEGLIDAHGAPVPRAARATHRRPGPAAVAHDGAWLRSVFWWGMRWQTDDGTPLLARNPLGAPAPGVKSALELPTNPSPRRPITDDARYELVRAAAVWVMMDARRHDAPTAMPVPTRPRRFNRQAPDAAPKPAQRWAERSYLYELLTLAWETGRRRSAVLDLRYEDLVWREGKIVALRWRPTKHVHETQVVPVSREAQRVLEWLVRTRPGVGPLPLFPSPRDGTRPVRAKTADQWLLEAEASAGVGHLAGGLWHPHRRGFATKRKHLPDADVARAGGWKTLQVLKEIYQQADDETLQLVVDEPRTLIKKSGGTPT